LRNHPVGKRTRIGDDLGLGVGQTFAVSLVDQEIGEVLERDLVGSLYLLERDAPLGRCWSISRPRPGIHRCRWSRRRSCRYSYAAVPVRSTPVDDRVATRVR
jgi:hypothetical protein